MNHKRKRSRSQRAGCKLCKPWKICGFPTERREGEKFGDHRRRMAAAQEVREHRYLGGGLGAPEG